MPKKYSRSPPDSKSAYTRFDYFSNSFKQMLNKSLKVNLTFFILFCICSKDLSADETKELDCIVKPEMYIELSSPVAGIVDKLFVDVTDFIHKGQVLAKLESSVEMAQVNLARQETLVDHIIQSKNIELAYSERNKVRYKGLHSKDAVSMLEEDKATTEAELAKIALNKAIDDKKFAKLKLEMAVAQLEQKTIKSPINGIVIERYVMPGETVRDRPIMKLAQIDPLRVELVAPAALFGKITKGMIVEIHPEKPANQIYQATVKSVDQLIDAASGSFTVRLALPNPNDKLIAGVNCVAKLNIPSTYSESKI